MGEIEEFEKMALARASSDRTDAGSYAIAFALMFVGGGIEKISEERGLWEIADKIDDLANTLAVALKSAS